MINACGTSALLATLRVNPITTSLIEEFAL
jgi:hypothetical protein